MSLLDRLERALEQLIEGKLMGRFTGRIHPLELARRLGAQMQAARRISVRRTYVPNRFHVRMSAPDRAPLLPIRAAVEEEIFEYLREIVRSREYHLSGPLQIEWVEESGFAPGQMAVEVEFAPGEEETAEMDAAPAAPAPAPIPAPAPAPTGARAYLAGRDGFVRGRVFALEQDRVVMGRVPDCAVYVPDAQVSREHGIFEWTGATYRLTDTSRNGIHVNGAPMEGPRELASGDRIEVGGSTMVYEMPASP